MRSSCERGVAGQPRAFVAALAILAGCASSLPRAAPVAEDLVVTTDGMPIEGELYAVGVSRDGRVVVFTSDAVNLVTGGVRGLYLLERPERIPRRLELEGSTTWWRVSEDGRYLVHGERGEWRRMSLMDGGPPELLMIGWGWWESPGILADGSGIAWVEDGVVQVAYFGRPERASIPLPLPGEASGPAELVSSRQGARLVVRVVATLERRSDLYAYLVDVGAGTAIELPRLEEPLPEAAVFSDDGLHLVARLWSRRDELSWLPVDGGPAWLRSMDSWPIVGPPLDDDRVIVRAGVSDPDPRRLDWLAAASDAELQPVLAEGLGEPMPSVSRVAVAAGSHELVAALALTDRPGRSRLVAVSLDPVMEP